MWPINSDHPSGLISWPQTFFITLPSPCDGCKHHLLFKRYSLNPLLFFLLTLVIYFLEQRGKEREREEEKVQGVVASCAPLLGAWVAGQACALTGNRTGDPLGLAGWHSIH